MICLDDGWVGTISVVQQELRGLRYPVPSLCSDTQAAVHVIERVILHIKISMRMKVILFKLLNAQNTCANL